VPREIFIVARDRPDLYRYLSQIFSDADSVQVIWDRRGADRRTVTSRRASTERRRSDRRARNAVEPDLQTTGYAFLSLPS
jgi:hypothetical protein